MMNFQWLTISMILIVLSIGHINAGNNTSVRQATTIPCPIMTFCDYIVCLNGGQCSENLTSAECYTCQCLAGFTGKTCETSTVGNLCASPCQNGGQCQQTGNIYTCACPAAYTGNQCETAVTATNPCVTASGNVCRNGGVCTVNGAAYVCTCASGWTGINCQTQQTTVTCSQSPCGAHGTCVQTISPTGVVSILCQCEAQWIGTYCDTNTAGGCSTGFCQSGGTCIMNGNTPSCQCPPTHTGQQCEILIGQTTTTTTGQTITTTSSIPGSTLGRCTSSSCSNGGSCYSTGNDFICVCKPEFAGPTCALQGVVTTPYSTTLSGSSPCLPNPCNNGGQCYKNGNGFVCVCTGPYAGLTCAMAKTTVTPPITTPGITCANQPCQNGATCYNAGGSYFCYCGAGSSYTGKNCETSTVSADPSCPLNCLPGYCVPTGDSQNAYACMCNGILTPTSCSAK